MPLDRGRLERTLPLLAEEASKADRLRAWPAVSWTLLRDAGVLRWCIPQEFGGAGLDGGELLTGYELLAGACLTTCFILSQREAACRRIVDSGNADLRRALLPGLASAKTFATVGLSQLTTSRQHFKPALVAEERGAHIVINGTMPWVTGAPHADFFITGAVMDSRQLLATVPRDARGVIVDPPLDLMALQGSQTSTVHCNAVTLERQWLLAGPAEMLMTSGRGTPGGFETSCLAIGLGGAAVDFIAGEAGQRPELYPIVERLESARRGLRVEMHELARGAGTAQSMTNLRARANSFVLRATQAALTAAKGAGFVHSHPAQRWARQALFFLVWSCPRPAAQATLDELTGIEPSQCP